jgi:LysR family transcriptional regulator, hydrogen peroxide-inducible genes activator
VTILTLLKGAAVELRQLIAFKEVAGQGSFTAAASHLQLTQSAVSQQIKALEDESGVVLFDRSGRVVRLTDAGHVFLTHVERILAQVENARVEMAEMAGGTRGHCRLASLPSIAAYLLPRALASFQKLYPGVELQLMESVQMRLLEWVQQGMVDFSIMSLPVHDPHLESIFLLRDEFVLMVPQDHALVQHKTARIANLVNERFILYPKGAGGRDLFVDACRQAGFEPCIAFESDDRETILGLVAAGVGITSVPRLIAHHTRVDGPVMIDITDPRLVREVGIVWRRQRYLPQAARHLITLLEKLVHESDLPSNAV